MSEKNPTVVEYVHSSDLFNSLSVNLAWVTEGGEKNPILEVYINSGRGPDLTKKFLLHLKGNDKYTPKELLEFGQLLIEGAKKIEQQMREQEEK